MLKRFIGRFASLALVVAALAGCGDSKPTSTGEFATVEVTATSPGTNVNADVSSDTSDSATFTVTSRPYTPPPTSTGTITPSNVSLELATVTYEPVDPQLPALPVQYPPVSGTIPPTSAAVPVSVVLATPQLKEYVRAQQAANPNLSFTYYVRVSFSGLEAKTDREETITASGVTTVTFTGFPAQ